MMKNLLISLICSAALVFGYYFFLALLYQIYPINFDTLATLLLPLNLPYNIYKSIFGFYQGDPTVVKVLNFIVAVLIYSAPIYLATNYLAKKKQKTKSQAIEHPPNPPVFESSSVK